MSGIPRRGIPVKRSIPGAPNAPPSSGSQTSVYTKTVTTRTENAGGQVPRPASAAIPRSIPQRTPGLRPPQQTRMIPDPRQIQRPTPIPTQSRMQQPQVAPSASSKSIRRPATAGSTVFQQPMQAPQYKKTAIAGRVSTGARPKQPTFEKELQSTLLESAAHHPKVPMKATGTKKTLTPAPLIQTSDGPVPATSQVISSKTVSKSPGLPDVVSRDLVTVKKVSPGQAEKTEVNVQKAIPIKSKKISPLHEVVQVQSSILIGPGVKQTTKTVVYEGDPGGIKKISSKPKPSPEMVAQLVAEENDLINRTRTLNMPQVKRISPSTYPVRKRAETYGLGSRVLEHSVGARTPSPDLDVENHTPEMIASLMNKEENGLNMDSSPANVYNYLFSDTKPDPVIEVTSIAPTPLEDVVIPTNSAVSPKVTGAVHVEIPNIQPVPEDKEITYTGTVSQPPAPKNVGRKGKKTKRKRVTLLTDEVPPWGMQKVDSIVDVVGASLADSKVVPEESMVEQDPFVEGIEYILEMQHPAHYSRVQLRGNKPPPWFPGYMLALPDVHNLITVARSPSAVFQAAWRATQPDIFDDNSLFVV